MFLTAVKYSSSFSKRNWILEYYSTVVSIAQEVSSENVVLEQVLGAIFGLHIIF